MDSTRPTSSHSWSPIKFSFSPSRCPNNYHDRQLDHNPRPESWHHKSRELGPCNWPRRFDLQEPLARKRGFQGYDDRNSRGCVGCSLDGLLGSRTGKSGYGGARVVIGLGGRGESASVTGEGSGEAQRSK